jgi:hypothetical protein
LIRKQNEGAKAGAFAYIAREFCCFLERSHLTSNKRVDAYGGCDLRVRGVAVS